VLCDRAEQHHQRRGARDQPGGGSHPEEAAPRDAIGNVVVVPMAVIVTVTVVRVVVMVMVTDPGRSDASAQHPEADRYHEKSRGQVQPRVEVLGKDVLREQQRHEPEHEHADRVRDRDDRAKTEGVARGAARSDQVGGDHRLAVTR
jgi:hypothetical protein